MIINLASYDFLDACDSVFILLHVWASLWVPANLYFVASFPSNRRFFTRNRRISKIVLCDTATGELSASTKTPDGNEKIRKAITLYVQYTFSAVIARLTLSQPWLKLQCNRRVIIKWRSSRLLFRWKSLPIQRVVFPRDRRRTGFSNIRLAH